MTPATKTLVACLALGLPFRSTMRLPIGSSIVPRSVMLAISPEASNGRIVKRSRPLSYSTWALAAIGKSNAWASASF